MPWEKTKTIMWWVGKNADRVGNELDIVVAATEKWAHVAISALGSVVSPEIEMGLTASLQTSENGSNCSVKEENVRSIAKETPFKKTNSIR